MTPTVFQNVRLVLPSGVRDGCIVERDGVIAGIHAGGACPMPDGAEVIDGVGRYLAPGYIDIHVHGGGGFDLMSDDPAQVRGYARFAATRGVTSFLVSTSGRDHADIVRRLRAVAPAIGHEPGAARALGFHLEGPYINPARKGAFPPQWLRSPAAGEYCELADAAGGHVRQVTLAPELPGAEIDAVRGSGATAAIGHTDATFEEAMRAIERGCAHVTHCFNAMRPFGHRDPGVLGAVMQCDDVTAELIGDGAHVDYGAARTLVRAKGALGIALVTDGMPLAGTADGDGEWEGQPIRVEGGKAVRVSDNTIIGGVSVITLDQTVRNAVAHLGVPLHVAVAMATSVPARAIGLEGRYGMLAPGAAADYVLLDDALTVAETWVDGERVPG
jgi:N-acetylglucosamine-6-phosphate deacetylase